MFCKYCGKKLNDDEKTVCRECKALVVELPGKAETNEEIKPIKKKPSVKKTALNVIIAVIVFSVVSIGFMLIENALEEKKNSPSDSGAVSSENYLEAVSGEYKITSDGTKYGKGSVSGNTYINEWANLKIVFDASFTEGTEEDYEVYQNLLYDCGAYFFDEKTSNEYGIAFYKAGGYTVKEYAEEAIETWQEATEDYFKDTFTAAVIEDVSYSREARAVEIAGEEYLASIAAVSTSDGVMMVYADYCAEKDGVIINIFTLTDTVEESLEAVSKISRIK